MSVGRIQSLVLELQVQTDECRGLEVPPWDRPFLQVWTDPLSNFSQEDSNTLGVRTVLIWSFLVLLYTLTRVAPNIPHNSGSESFSSGENCHAATIEIACSTKLKGMIIGSILSVKSFFKWASSVDLTLHLSQHNSD